MDMMCTAYREAIAFDALVRHLAVPTYVVDRDGRVMVWNAACEELTGVDADEVVGTRDHWRAFHSEQRPCLADLVATGGDATTALPGSGLAPLGAVPGGVRGEGWYDMPRRGTPRYLSSYAGPIRDDDGRIIAVIESLCDGTLHKQAEANLQVVEAILAASSEGMMVTDCDSRIQRVNPAFTRITGYAADEVVGQTPRLLRSNVHGTAFYRQLWDDLAATGEWRGELWNRRKTGEVYLQRLRIVALRDAQGAPTHYIGLLDDITEWKQAQERIDDLATHDLLTGLPNRVGLVSRLQHAIAAAARLERLVAVCYIDLDSFKPVNDIHGAGVGDQVLLEVARRLTQATRAADTVARLGGDEFVMLLTELKDMAEVEHVVGRVLAAIAHPVFVNALRISISASIGVTVHPADPAPADTLIRHADQAMYLAKSQGRNAWHLYNVADESKSKHAAVVLARARQALQAGEFRLFYQPKVNLATGAVVGLEALIRWQHPERGMVPPGEFLPYLENSPFIVDLGEWVMREALRQMTAWHRAGIAMKVSVNIAARQLQHPDFLGRLQAILGGFPDLPPRLLEIEVLESSALEDIENMRAILARCNELGIAFALDDFGTGYSTLNYLRRLPARTLKIDQTFVRDILNDKEDLALVEGVIGLATTFGMEVIAEGVESIEQCVLLLRIGCSEIQGYYIARPMPAPAVPAWLEAFRPDPSWQRWSATSWDRTHLPLVLAEYDHLKWVQRVLAWCADEPADFDPDEVSDHHACRFGQWYDHDGARQYGHLPAFREIDGIHREIHDTGQAMLDLHRRGERSRGDDQARHLAELKDQIVARLSTLRNVLLAGGTDAGAPRASGGNEPPIPG